MIVIDQYKLDEIVLKVNYLDNQFQGSNRKEFSFFEEQLDKANNTLVKIGLQHGDEFKNKRNIVAKKINNLLEVIESRKNQNPSEIKQPR